MDLRNFIQNANKVGSDIYGGLNAAYNTVDKAIGGRLPYGVPEVPSRKKLRKAGDVFQSGREGFTKADANNPVTAYLNDVPDKGLFPIISLNPTHESLMTAAKYAAGPFGRPIRILRSPETGKKLQEQIDGASVRDGKLYHGLGEPNYEETRFPSNVQGHGIVGQFIGIPESNNDVTVSEPYDTKEVQWHRDKFDEHIASGNYKSATESALNMGFKSLEDIGWANLHPRGKTQIIGQLKPGHALYKD